MNTRNALIVAILVFIVLSIIDCTTTTHLRTVIDCYQLAAANWLNNQNIYFQRFIYLPQSAILLIPFAHMPLLVFSIAWRAIWMSLTLYALFKFSEIRTPWGVDGSRSYSKDEESRAGLLFFLLVFVTLIMGWDSLKNGQLNTAILVFGLLSLLAIYVTSQKPPGAAVNPSSRGEDRGMTLAAFFLTLGLALKTLFLPIVALCFVLYPRIRLKLLVMLAILFFIPFIGKNTHYVLSQYADLLNYYHELGRQDAVTGPFKWAQIFSVLHLFGIHTTPFICTVLRAIFAVLTLWFAWLVNRSELDAARKISLIYAALTSYLLLFGTRTESDTYIIFAPVVGLLLYEAIFIEKNLWLSVITGIIFIGFIEAWELSKLMGLPQDGHSVVSPLLCCVTMGIIVWRFVYHKCRRNTHTHCKCIGSNKISSPIACNRRSKT